MASRMPKPIETWRVEGDNGYALEIHDHGEEVGVSAVIVGIKTGKRHANVVLPWADMCDLVAALEMRIDNDYDYGDDTGPGLTTIEPKEQYL